MDKTTPRHIFFQTYEDLVKSTGQKPTIEKVLTAVYENTALTKEQLLEGYTAFKQGMARIQKNAKRHQNLLRNQQKRFFGR